MYFIYVNKDLLAKPSHLPFAILQFNWRHSDKSLGFV